MSHVELRLKEYIDKKGLSIKKLERETDIANGSIARHFKKEGKGLSSSAVENLLRHLTDLNSEWLLTGQGKMLKSDAHLNAHLNAHLSGSKVAEPAAVYHNDQGIPYYNIEAHAGNGIRFDTIMEGEQPDAWVQNSNFSTAKLCIKVFGDSMYTNTGEGIRPGSTIYLRPVSNDTRSLDLSRVYVIVTVDQWLLKRLKYKDEGSFWAVSDNPAYQEFPLYREDILHLLVVIGWEVREE